MGGPKDVPAVDGCILVCREWAVKVIALPKICRVTEEASSQEGTSRKLYFLALRFLSFAVRET